LFGRIEEMEQTATNGTKYLTPKDLAERWQISERQITKMARKGILPGVRIGKLWRFRPEEIGAWERNQSVDTEEVDQIVDEIVKDLN
jgi:excisionase family DNA binding protein